MFYDLKKSNIFQALIVSKLLPFGLIKTFAKLFFAIFLILLAVFAFGFYGRETSITSLTKTLGTTLTSFSIAVLLWQTNLLFEKKLKNPLPDTPLDRLTPESKVNLADWFDFQTSLVLDKAQSLAWSRKTPVNDDFILFALLASKQPLVCFVFTRLIVNLDQIRGVIRDNLRKSFPGQEKDLSGFWAIVLESAKNSKNQKITLGNLFVGLAKYNSFLKEILVQADIKAEDIENLCWWWENSEKKQEQKKKFWEYENLIRKGSLGKQWSAGYTLTLDQFAVDWTEFVRKRGFEEIVGHEKEIEQIERSLAKSEFNNVLLVGDPGSGRGAILQALTQKIFFGQSLEELNYKRVVELDLVSLASRSQTPEQASQILEQIFQEILAARNIILVIQDFHNFIAQAQRPGTINISGIISNYLQDPRFKFIAVTNFADFHKTVEPNSLNQFFSKVEISPISVQETIKLCQLFVPGWEMKYKKFISYPAVKNLVVKADRFLPALPFPKKATDLMEEVLVSLRQTKQNVLLPKDIDKIVSEKTEIPVGQLSLEEKQTLLNLETILHERIINQEEAVKEVSSALRRARADITVRKGPMGAFLFLGPTGVGKTETAKALAAVYFGSEDRIVRLDLSEYQNPQDLKRLIGSIDEQSFFADQVREKPFTLVLLDEIEKAHPNILNLFLQVLDEGFMTDGLGRKLSFTNTIIIATSNAGYQVILDALAKNMEMPAIKEQLLDFIFNQGIFRPEFINRFDAVVVFKSLTKENLLGIANLLLAKLKKNLAEKGIELLITDALKEKVANLGYDPVFGARKMRRVIQDKVENAIASALLSGQTHRGSKIEITGDFELIVS